LNAKFIASADTPPLEAGITSLGMKVMLDKDLAELYGVKPFFDSSEAILSLSRRM
jgi:hypothetical protein